MDLEWNNAYMKSTKKFINEIIEIGAVKLNEQLEIVDTYSELIKPSVSKKLRTRIKDLTHITNEDVLAGKPFEEAIAQLEEWVGDDTLVMTWGDTDVRTMLTNFKCFLKNINFVPRTKAINSRVIFHRAETFVKISIKPFKCFVALNSCINLFPSMALEVHSIRRVSQHQIHRAIGNVLHQFKAITLP